MIEIETGVQRGRHSGGAGMVLMRGCECWSEDAVESEINRLEHHGLNRCLDVGLQGCQRYVGCGVLSYNLHVIGRELLARQRVRGDRLALAA